jgi:hypothetical protein
MEILGYYAKDKNKNLFQFEWGANDEFYIMNSDGDMVMKDPNEYEIIEVGYFIEYEDEVEDEDITIIEKRGRELEWDLSIPTYYAKPGAKAIVTKDYTSKCEFIYVKFIDELGKGQQEGGYYRHFFK